MFSTLLEIFPPFSLNLKLSSANSFSLEESKICRLRKGSPFTKQQNFRLPTSKETSWYGLTDEICVWPFLKQALDLAWLHYKSFENFVEKGEIASFPEHFRPFQRTFYYFHQIWHCRLLFLMARINRSGHIGFWPVRPSVCMSAKTYIGHGFWMVSDRAFIFHIYIPFFGTKVKVIHQGQCQISGSHFSCESSFNLDRSGVRS